MKKMKPLWKIKLNRFMTHWAIVLFIVLLAVYVLFSDDIRLAFFAKSADDGFSYLTCIVMGVFTIEIALNVISADEYLNSFYFWLDVISVISLILDIRWVMESMWEHHEQDFVTQDPDVAAVYARERFGEHEGS